MDFFHERHTTFKFVEEVFNPSNNSSQFTIKLHFIFKSQTKHYILNQGQPQCLLTSFPYCNGLASVAVSAAGDSPPPVAAAVGNAVRGRLPDAAERGELAELVQEQVSRRFPAPAGVLRLSFEVCIERRHVYAFFGDGGDRMVPAADVAVEQLEEYDVGCAADVAEAEEEERCCCICLEELGGGGGRRRGGAARMPCKHVFHGGCIKKWLRKSHYCPICRYEMPTE